MLSFLIKNTKYITFALLAFFGIIFFANAQTGGSQNINFIDLNVDFSWDSEGDAIVGVSGVVPWFPGLVNSSIVVKVEVSPSPFNNPDSYNGNFDLILSNNTSSQFSFNSYAESLSQQFYVPGSTFYFLFRVDGMVGTQQGSGYEVVSIEIPQQSNNNTSGGVDDASNNNQTDGGGEISPPNPVTTVSGPTVIDLGLTNPLAGTIDNLPQLFQKIVEIIIKIGIPLVAIAILYSGFLFVTARGNDSQLKTAKNALLFAVIGGLILLASWLVAEAIRDAIMTIND